MTQTKRDFLTLLDLSSDELQQLIRRAIELKAMRARRESSQMFQGMTLAMLFEKSSTRTRVSFETAMAQMGGHAMFLSPRDTQMGRGEPVGDTARVLSRMVDAIMIRNHDHELVRTLAAEASIAVINGLTDRFHPCQLLADLQTFTEHRGDVAGATVAWIGDGNNVCNSYILAARQMGFDLRIAAPPGYQPDEEVMALGQGKATLVDSPAEAAWEADWVVTDVWASMGDELQQQERKQAFATYQVSAEIMAQASKDAVFMHCLPAHRGEEVSAQVIDGPQSVVWDEAENRLHAQKALLEFLLC